MRPPRDLTRKAGCKSEGIHRRQSLSHRNGSSSSSLSAGPAEEIPRESSTSTATSMRTTSITTNAGPAEENPGYPSTDSIALFQGNSTPSLTKTDDSNDHTDNKKGHAITHEKMLGEDECDYEIIVDVKEEEERMIRRDLARKHKPTCRIREKTADQLRQDRK